MREGKGGMSNAVQNHEEDLAGVRCRSMLSCRLGRKSKSTHATVAYPMHGLHPSSLLPRNLYNKGLLHLHGTGKIHSGEMDSRNLATSTSPSLRLV